MSIKVLSNWTYTPKFAGNEKMVIEFKRLSGVEEMTIIKDENRTDDALLIASIASIKNPLKLEMPDGNIRDMKLEDIGNIPELKDLFYELILAKNENADSGGAVAKKPE